MGSDASDEVSDREHPVHTVTPTRAYAIGTHEVTNDQSAAVLNEALDRGWAAIDETLYDDEWYYWEEDSYVINQSGDRQVLLILLPDGYYQEYRRITYGPDGFSVAEGDGDHSATMVTWYGAVAFAYYLNAIEGRPVCRRIESRIVL